MKSANSSYSMRNMNQTKMNLHFESYIINEIKLTFYSDKIIISIIINFTRDIFYN
jgi:hypothetical protein